MYENKEVLPYVQEKTEILRRLDGQYDDPEKKIADSERLSELNRLITTSNLRFLEQFKTERPVSLPRTVEITIRDIRKKVNEKHDFYKEGAAHSLKMYQEMVLKKKEGKALLEELRGKKELSEKELKQLLEKVNEY